MSHHAQAEHLLRLYRTLRQLGEQLEALDAVMKEIDGFDDCRAHVNNVVYRMKADLGLCLAEINEMDSGIEDMA